MNNLHAIHENSEEAPPIPEPGPVWNQVPELASLLQEGPFEAEEGVREDWKEFKDVLARNGVRHLYHFTDRSNLASIKAFGGLGSWWLLKKLGIDIPRPSGNGLSRKLDIRARVHNQVHLSFSRQPKMLAQVLREQRVLNPVMLEVSPEVVYLFGSSFSLDNAVSRRAEFCSEPEKFERIIKLRNAGYYNGKDCSQSEVMIPEFVPLRFITGIHSLSRRRPGFYR